MRIIAKRTQQTNLDCRLCGTVCQTGWRSIFTFHMFLKAQQNGTFSRQAAYLELTCVRGIQVGRSGGFPAQGARGDAQAG